MWIKFPVPESNYYINLNHIVCFREMWEHESTNWKNRTSILVVSGAVYWVDMKIEDVVTLLGGSVN